MDSTIWRQARSPQPGNSSRPDSDRAGQPPSFVAAVFRSRRPRQLPLPVAAERKEPPPDLELGRLHPTWSWAGSTRPEGVTAIAVAVFRSRRLSQPPAPQPPAPQSPSSAVAVPAAVVLRSRRPRGRRPRSRRPRSSRFSQPPFSAATAPCGGPAQRAATRPGVGPAPPGRRG